MTTYKTQLEKEIEVFGCSKKLGRASCGEVSFENKIILCDDCVFKLIEEYNKLLMEKAKCGNCSFMAEKIKEAKLEGYNQARKEEVEFLKEWYSIATYKSHFKDDIIEKRIKELEK